RRRARVPARAAPSLDPTPGDARRGPMRATRRSFLARSSTVLGIALGICLAGGTSGNAATPPPGAAVLGSAWLDRAGAHPALAAKRDLRTPWTKVGRSLREIVAGVGTGAVLGVAATTSAMEGLGLRTDHEGRVHVTVRVSSLTPDQSALLRSSGL